MPVVGTPLVYPELRRAAPAGVHTEESSPQTQSTRDRVLGFSKQAGRNQVNCTNESRLGESPESIVCGARQLSKAAT